MSDVPQGEGWWQASDGKWYPPAQEAQAASTPPGDVSPGAVPPPPGAPAPADPAEGQGGGSGKGMLVLILVVVVVVVGAVVGFMLLGGDDEPEDAVAEETVDEEPDVDAPAEIDRLVDGPINFDQVYEDRLEDGRTEARYTFDAPDSAIMTLTVSNSADSARRVIALLSSEGERFDRMTVAPGAQEEFTVHLDHQGGAPFELEFTDGPAAFEFELALALQQDGGQPGDAGDDFASGLQIQPGTAVEGMLAGQDRVDVYLVEVEPGAELRFQTENARSSQRRTIFDLYLDGDRLHRATVNPGASEEFTYLFSGEHSGVLEVIASDGPSDYSFQVDFTPQADGGQPGDAGATIADARLVPTGQELMGQVGDGDAADVYLFEAPSGQVEVEIMNEATSERRVIVDVFDPSGDRVTRLTVNPGATEVAEFDTEAGEEYRLEVSDGRADYRFTVTG